MAGSAHISDFLRLHANVSRRVRNLETGVHPTSSESGFADVIYPTSITITNPDFVAYRAGFPSQQNPQWQRRNGIVTLLGGIQPAATWAAADTSEKIGTLPAAARPLTSLTMIAAAENSPWIGSYTVTPDGELYVRDLGTSDNTPVKFEGANWTVD